MRHRILLFGVAVSVTAAALAIAGSVRAQSNGTGAAAAATPRMPDGKPDLSGVWGAGGAGGSGREDAEGNITSIINGRRCAPNQVQCGDYTNQSEDGEFTNRLNANRPIYKPKYWDKVQQLDMWSNKYDPIFVCQPFGIPRAGPPARIIQSASDIVLFYGRGPGGGPEGAYRVIPIDGRRHDPEKAQDVFFWGDSVGRWDGETLIIDSIAFNDLTWFGMGGYFHSDQMHAIERFRREGNMLQYDVTIEDPEVLAQPWVLTPRQLRLNTNRDAGLLPEPTPCREYDFANMVTQIRH